MLRLTRRGALGLPVSIWTLLAIDLAFAVVYLVDHALGGPQENLSALIDLDGEANLPTWYAAVLWFAVSLVLFGVAGRRSSGGDRRSWFLWLLPPLFLALSIDEVVQVHEYVGVRADVLLPGGTRSGSALPETGLFFAVVGVPFAAGIAVLLVVVRPWLSEPRGGLRSIVVGMTVMLTGAVGFDFLANFVAEHSAAAVILICIEETLEMVGATFILWGGYALLVWPDGYRLRPEADARVP